MRARGEVAATRALANAARMVAGQPALLQLRTLQAVEACGATVHLSTATDARPGAPSRSVSSRSAPGDVDTGPADAGRCPPDPEGLHP